MSDAQHCDDTDDGNTETDVAAGDLNNNDCYVPVPVTVAVTNTHTSKPKSTKNQPLSNSQLECLDDSILDTNLLDEKLDDGFGKLMNWDLQHGRLSCTPGYTPHSKQLLKTS